MPVNTVRSVPNQPKTPARGVRVPDELWNAAKAQAAANGETVTDVLLRALREYVGEPVDDPSTTPADPPH
jgi:hypothetical protein